MTNVPKPDLEHGAYIVYTDEPGEILSPGSTGGGGGVVVIELTATDEYQEIQASYNDLYEHFINGKVCILHVAVDKYYMYGMLPIAGLAHSDTNYKAIVIWPFTGGTTTNVDFEADNATDNLRLVFGG